MYYGFEWCKLGFHVDCFAAYHYPEVLCQKNPSVYQDVQEFLRPTYTSTGYVLHRHCTVKGCQKPSELSLSLRIQLPKHLLRRQFHHPETPFVCVFIPNGTDNVIDFANKVENERPETRFV